MMELGEAVARASEAHRPKGIDLALAGFVAGLVASQTLRPTGDRSSGSGRSTGRARQ